MASILKIIVQKCKVLGESNKIDAIESILAKFGGNLANVWEWELFEQSPKTYDSYSRTKCLTYLTMPLA